MARVLIVASLAESLINFRGDLIKYILAQGHTVMVASPYEAPEVDSVLNSWGVTRFKISLNRTGLNVLSDLLLMFQLRRLMCNVMPDVVLSYTIKPVIYASLAARWVGVPRIAVMITGLGFAFADSSTVRQSLIRMFARFLYRMAMICSNTVFFQNPDDERDFRRYGLVHSSQSIIQIGGSGVNLDQFAPIPLPGGSMSFLMVARLIIDKGVREFMNAATIAHGVRSDLRFHLVGPLENHPSALPRAELDAFLSSSPVIYHGSTSDVRMYIAKCHVFVLPSYREGMPRSVLEAMATCRPIITTDVPGCRDTVQHGVNGFLVPPRDSKSLADAMLKMAELTHTEIFSMAKKSRTIAETRFDVNQVNKDITRGLSL